MKAGFHRLSNIGLFLAVAASLASPFAGSASAAIAEKPPVGKPAPDFKLQDWNGKEVSLSQFRKKFVVLEWFSDECPFVKKHYNSGNMQALQKEFTKKGVVWLTICSSAPGKPGHHSADGHKQLMHAFKGNPTDLLIDEDGKVGRMYGSKNTPTMYVIDKTGTLIYEGAIDDKPDADPASVAASKNFVRAALDSAMDGKPVAESITKAYG